MFSGNNNLNNEDDKLIIKDSNINIELSEDNINTKLIYEMYSNNCIKYKKHSNKIMNLKLKKYISCPNERPKLDQTIKSYIEKCLVYKKGRELIQSVIEKHPDLFNCIVEEKTKNKGEFFIEDIDFKDLYLLLENADDDIEFLDENKNLVKIKIKEYKDDIQITSFCENIFEKYNKNKPPYLIVFDGEFKCSRIIKQLENYYFKLFEGRNIKYNFDDNNQEIEIVKLKQNKNKINVFFIENENFLIKKKENHIKYLELQVKENFSIFRKEKKTNLDYFSNNSLTEIREILFDSREMSCKVPLCLSKLVKVYGEFLPIGDYVLSNDIVVERKSLITGDLFESIKSGRLDKQIIQMSDSFDKMILLLEMNANSFQYKKVFLSISYYKKIVEYLIENPKLCLVFSYSEEHSAIIMNKIKGNDKLNKKKCLEMGKIADKKRRIGKKQNQESTDYNISIIKGILRIIKLSILHYNKNKKDEDSFIISSLNIHNVLSLILSGYSNLKDFINSEKNKLEGLLGTELGIILYNYFMIN